MLPACLESVRGVVDEIVVVDTGSTDATREIAARHGAVVHERAWDDDFSAARNEALRHATGDWVLQLDADERLAPGAGPVLREAMRRADLDLGMLRLHHARRLDASPREVVSGRERMGDPGRLPRLMRRTPDLEYRGVVHESVLDWVARRGMRVGAVDADIVHLGAVPELRAGLGKHQRNLALLEKRCRLEPDSVTPRGYLALELWEDGRFEEAARIAEEGWNLLELQPSYRSARHVGVVRALCQARAGDHRAMRETVERLVEREGLGGDTAFLRGVARELAAWSGPAAERPAGLEEAARHYREALERRPGLEERSCIPGGTAIRSRVRLGTALLAIGLSGPALEEFRRALAEDGEGVESRLGEAEALVDLGEAGRALALLEPMLAAGEGGPDSWALAAAAAQAAGAPGDARAFLAGARERAAGGWVAVHRIGRCEALAASLAGRPEESAALLAAILERRPVPPELRGLEPAETLLREVARRFLSTGRGRLLGALLEPAAAAVSPGLPERTRAVLERLAAAPGGAGP
jgi:tetratricopeptide (TPR) repeat protein